MRPREYRRAKAPQRMLIQPMARLRYPAGWAVVNKSLGKFGAPRFGPSEGRRLHFVDQVKPALVFCPVATGWPITALTFMRKLPTQCRIATIFFLGGVRLFGGPIRRRYFKRPDAFRQIARLDDRRLDRVLAFLVRRENHSARR